jgi:hypothetical protein
METPRISPRSTPCSIALTESLSIYPENYLQSSLQMIWLCSMFPSASEPYRVAAPFDWLHDTVYDALSGVGSIYFDHEAVRDSVGVGF